MASLITRGKIYYAQYMVGQKAKRISLKTESLQLVLLLRLKDTQLSDYPELISDYFERPGSSMVTGAFVCSADRFFQNGSLSCFFCSSQYLLSS
jgi:hypothetical protein